MTTSSASLAARGQDWAMREDDHGARPTRRQFSASYKLAILEEYAALTEPGAKGALLRREGLYSSHLVEWRRARDTGALTGTPAKANSAARGELDQAKRRIAKLEDQLHRHQQALEAQGKASELLARLLAESSQTNEQPPRR
jgi:transposase-like protein